MPKYVLVYQCGLANVFRELTRTRVLQGSFRECEAFARGLGEMGASVRTMYCNRTGDIAALDVCWNTNFDDAPFNDQMQPVNLN